MALDKKSLSAIILILLVAVVAVAFLFGVQNAKVGQKSLENVAVQITDPLYGPSSVSSLNVTYSSLGLDVMAANGSSSWYYYNASGNLDLLELQNYSYTVAQFGLPLNSTVDGARLSLTGVNISIYGNAGKVFLTNSSLYARLNSVPINGSGEAILLQLNPSVLSVQNRSGLYFAVTPRLSAHSGKGGLSFAGSFEPINSSVGAGLSFGSGNLTLLSAQIVPEANATSISVTVKNQGLTPQRIGPIMIVGNFSSHGISNSTALAAVLSSVISTNTLSSIFSGNTLGKLNATGSALENLSSSINTSELTKIEQNLPAGVRSNLSAAVSSGGAGISSAIGGLLGHLNSSSLGSITSQLHLGSNFSLSSLGGLAGSIESALGSFRNSSLEASVLSNAVQNQYNQYVAKAKVLGEQERALNAITLLTQANGTLVTASTASQLLPQNWDLLQPGQTTTLSFNGLLTSSGNGFFSAAHNNTYKIILSGDNSTLNVTTH